MRLSPLTGAVPIVFLSAGVVMGVASPTVASEVRQPAPQTIYGPVTYPGTLESVSAVSASDVWAVGFNSDNNNDSTALIEHWNGRFWSQVATPRLKANGGSQLYGVSALASDDAWAVGTVGTGTEYDTLILHWDGTSWTQVPSPSPGGASGSYLFGVSAVSATDIWAVGRTYNGPLILHWDGTAWTQVDAPGAVGTSLNSVAAVSGTDAFAVGNTFGAFSRPFVLRWDGTHWNQLTLGAAKRGRADQVTGVSATSASDVWAVGTTTTWRHVRRSPMILHFDGSSWQRVDGVNPGGRHGTQLAGVSAVNPHDVWAVGSYGIDHSDLSRTFIEHWNGTSWRQTHTPNPGNDGIRDVNGIDALGRGAWAAGSFLDTGQVRSMTLNRIGNRWIQL